MAMFGSCKIWRKMPTKEKREEKKNEKKKKSEGKSKKDLRSIYYFYMLLQTHFTNVSSSI